VLKHSPLWHYFGGLKFTTGRFCSKFVDPVLILLVSVKVSWNAYFISHHTFSYTHTVSCNTQAVNLIDVHNDRHLNQTAPSGYTQAKTLQQMFN
jgi:hypothetical protein